MVACQRKGKELGELAGNKRQYAGIGGATSLGKRLIPFGLLTVSGKVGEGAVGSNELDNDNPLLLSFQAQKTLGVVAYKRADKCYLEEFEDLHRLVSSS